MSPWLFILFWNSLTYSDPCTLISRELYVAADLFRNFELLNGVSILSKKRQLTHKALKKRREAKASVEGLDNPSSILWIIILCFIT